MPRVYGELRKLARAYASSSRTLHPTALVHELFVKLINAGRIEARDRGHFLAVAAKAMRRIAIDAARAAQADKRGGSFSCEPLHGLDLPGLTADAAVVRLNNSLDQLERSDPRKAAVVEMKFFGGMEMREIAVTLDVSLATVERDWKFARAWLYQSLAEQ